MFVACARSLGVCTASLPAAVTLRPHYGCSSALLDGFGGQSLCFCSVISVKYEWGKHSSGSTHICLPLYFWAWWETFRDKWDAKGSCNFLYVCYAEKPHESKTLAFLKEDDSGKNYYTNIMLNIINIYL